MNKRPRDGSEEDGDEPDKKRASSGALNPGTYEAEYATGMGNDTNGGYGEGEQVGGGDQVRTRA